MIKGNKFTVFPQIKIFFISYFYKGENLTILSKTRDKNEHQGSRILSKISCNAQLY